MNVQLQVLGYALRTVADEMGAALIRSAFSANIKERRDCSTAIFDAAGRMVAQAEHIPVHLGAMPASVAAVIACDPGPDDVFILNDPYAGGTHLPDITLVSRTELGFAATRAHHADVGGATPGSMPAGSRTLEEEGVVIPPTRLDEATLEALVAQMRNPDERRGDLRAQLAAQRLGARRIAELCARRGRDEVTAAMGELVAYSERRVRAGIAALPDGRYEASELLETADGELELRVAASVAGDELELDFAGTAAAARGQPQLPAGGDHVRLPVRRPRPDRSGRARIGRGARPRHGSRAGGLPRQRASHLRRSPQATSRRRAGSSTCSSAPSRRRFPCRRRARER